MYSTLSRRSLVGAMAVSGVALGGVTMASKAAPSLLQSATPEATPTGPFTLPELPYAYDALEPYIDTLTMQIHHDKHHATYVKNLNTAVADYPELQAMTVEELITDLDAVPEVIRTAVRNNGGGHANHSMFWESMGPDQGSQVGDFYDAIVRDFGDLATLQTAINDAGIKRFGSGWSWLVANDGVLSVLSTPNQDSPLMDGSGIPILGVDVWEHAYYLKYQNLRADYLTAWWNVVNWTTIEARYAAALGE